MTQTDVWPLLRLEPQLFRIRYHANEFDLPHMSNRFYHEEPALSPQESVDLRDEPFDIRNFVNRVESHRKVNLFVNGDGVRFASVGADSVRNTCLSSAVVEHIEHLLL